MAYRNTRPESPKGQVYHAFASSGERAARQKAKELGGISDSKVERWFREWADSVPPKRTERVERVTTKSARVMPKKKRKGQFVLEIGARVRLEYDDDDTWGPGRIVKVGEVVSTWVADSDKRERHEPNRHFIPE